MARTVYVYDLERRRMVDKTTREPMVTGAWNPAATPAVRGDIEPYVSPADGVTVIRSRSAMRDDMAKHGCIDYRDRWGERGMGFSDPVFARKHGMPKSHIND